MNSCQKFLSTSLLALFASAAFAAAAPPLDTAGDFAVLGSAVTTTASSITGNVGSPGAVSFTSSTITGNVVNSGALTCTPPLCSESVSGTISSPLPGQVVTDFNEAYAALNQPCDHTILTAAFTDAALPVSSGVTCFPAAVTFTRTVLTLNGNGPWILRVGTQAAGALTGTSLTVVVANGGDACDVFWQVNAATTLTTSVFRGTVLAGAAITTTGGTVAGRLLATAAVSMTGTTVIGCDSALPGSVSCKPRHHHKKKKGHDRDHDDDDDHDHDGDDHDDHGHDGKGHGDNEHSYDKRK